MPGGGYSYHGERVEVNFEEKKERVPHKSVWRSRGRLAIRLAGGTALLLVLIWFAPDAGDEIKALEAWISGHGLLGPFVFVAAAVVLSSVFVPCSVLGAVAGFLVCMVFMIGVGRMAQRALSEAEADAFEKPSNCGL